MTEDLKFIVAEVNKILKSDYNLISFDSLSIENLLQTLLDVLQKFGAANKFEVKESDPADTNKYILDSLKKIQYKPPNTSDNDPTSFRRLLLQGDKKTIYPILQFIFKNAEKVKSLAYLAHYLIPISLPPEAIANQEIATLWDEYQLMLSDFKEAHRTHSESKKESAQFKELRNDIGIIEVEKENVNKRLERTQSRLDKIPQQELLLEAAQALRVERERQKELQNQLETQKQSVQKATTAHERLLKELNTAQISSHDAAPQYLLQSLLEETEVARFMVKQKLPQEIAIKKQEIQLLDEVLNHPSISREYLNDLQDQIDKVGSDVHKLIEHQLTDRGNQNDNLLPFRQQAASVARNKDMAAEQLAQLTKELRDVENQISKKQEILNGIMGGTVLRGEELKQYVNMLRAKSSVYKQKRAELAALKAEANDLQQTLDNLKQQDPNLTFPIDGEQAQDDSIDGLISRPTSPIESRGVTELARLVDGLTRAVMAARERATPLSQQIGPFRLKLTELKDRRDLKKQTYNALNATLTAEEAVLHNDVTDAEKTVKKLETTWQDLQTEYTRIENLLEKAKEEKNGSKGSLKDSLTEQIREQEELAESLAEENRVINSENGGGEKQHAMWADLNTLLRVKLECLHEAKQSGVGGTLFVQKGTETFTLQ